MDPVTPEPASPSARHSQQAPFHGGHPTGGPGHHGLEDHGPSFSLQQMEEMLDVRRIFHLFLSNIIPIAILLAVSLIAVGGYLLRMPDIYESRAIIQVEQQEKKVLKAEKVTDESPATADFVNSVVQALTSRNVLLRVVKANHLQDNPDFAPPRSGGRPYTDSQLAQIMEKKVKVSLRRLTRLIDITVEDQDPELACTLAKSMVSEFLREGFEQRLSVSKVADQYLQQEAAKLKVKLEKSEMELQAYKEQHNAVSLEQSQNITVEQLKDVNSAVTEAKNARLKLESDLEQFRTVKKNGNLDEMLRVQSVAALPEVSSVREELLKAETELASLKDRYLAKHPKSIAAKEKLESLRSKMAEVVGKADNLLSNRYQSALENEQKLNGSLKEQEAKALDLNKISIPYNVLAREVETDRALYESVVSRMKETTISSGVETAPYRVIEEPMIPSKPSKPHRLKILLLVTIVIILGSAFGLLVKDALSNAVRSVDQAETLFSLPVLAAIPDQRPTRVERVVEGIRTRKKPKDILDSIVDDPDRDTEGSRTYSIPPVDDPGSIISEAYRTLRTSVTLLGPKETTRMLLFTSAIPEEGKTFCSINTAVTFALQGEKTLIVDTDMRRPSVHRGLLKGEERPGMTDLLSGQATLDQVIGSTPVENLSIITAGRRAPNPLELLTQADIPALLAELLKRFDRVVIDSAPVNAVSDTLHISGPARQVILVIRSEKTPTRVIQRSLKLLRKTGTHMAGMVLNRTRTGAGYGYYYYSYGGKYYENSVYGAEKDRKG